MVLSGVGRKRAGVVHQYQPESKEGRSVSVVRRPWTVSLPLVEVETGRVRDETKGGDCRRESVVRRFDRAR
jgi:hypothetical protein